MALPDGIGSTKELLDAQSHIWNHVFSFINSVSLKCAIQLGIPDIIHNHNKPMKLSELTNALAINKAKSACVQRLMRILIHSKFFIMAKNDDGEEDEGYWLTPASRLLLRDEPLSLALFVLGQLDPILTNPGHHMSEWFRNDDPTTFATAHGRTFWEATRGDPRLNKLFNECMSSDTQLVTCVIVKDCGEVFEELESMVDVGGGTGTMSKAIADAFPRLRCIVLDLPHVIEGLEGTENLRFVEGDMFQSIPSAHAVFLKCILHDWSDEECIQIMEKCKEAINPSKEKGGKVVIVDIVVVEGENSSKAMETQLMFDILMMIAVSGKERTEQDWAYIFHAAGFTTYKITPLLGLRSLIEVFP